MKTYVASGGDRSAPENELRLNQAIERVLQGRVVECGRGLEQSVIEVATDAGGGLRDLLDRLQPIETRHQRVIKRRGDGEMAQRATELKRGIRLHQHFGFEHGLGDLLDEQRRARRCSKSDGRVARAEA